MNNVRLNAIRTLYAKGLVLGLVGLVFLANSASQKNPDDVPQVAIPGYVCLGISVVFALTSSVLAFFTEAPSGRDRKQDASGSSE